MIFILERLTYDKLFRVSDPARVTRSLEVRGPPLEIDSYQDTVYYAFNFKSYPSTTGLRHRGYIKFFKPKSGKPMPLQHVECVVDCMCPDYKYRWAWANKQRGSSTVGPQSLNQAWNRAPRKTNPTGKPGLCKHILAARQYIYGLLATFPGDEPDTSDKLNQLTKIAQKRWTDFPGQMQAAKRREAEMRRRQALRNVVGPRVPPPPVPAAERPISTLNRRNVPEPTKSTGAFRNVLPSKLPAGTIKKPVTPAKPAKPAAPKAAPKPPKLPKPLPHGAYGLLDSEQEQDFKNPLLECVVKSNGESMTTTLNEAIKLVEEMETDEVSLAQTEPLEPSEPPVSDSAVGADTKEDTALELLRQMRDSLQQLATVLAPQEPVEGEEGAPEGSPEGAMPPEPPADEEEGGEESPEEEEEEEIPNRRPVAK